MVQQTAPAVVKVDGDRLAEAIRRVSPFMGEGNPPNLAGVYAEAGSGVLQLTACDGHRMGHLTVTLPFPDGNWLLKAAGVKDFSQRHYNGQEIEVKLESDAPGAPLLVGDVRVELETTAYINYPAVIPDDLDTEAIIDPKAWIKVLRQHKPENVGIVFSAAGCRMFMQDHDGETFACESLPVQMFSGPDKKVKYVAEQFRRGLTSCGAGATLQVGDPTKATLMEADDYWYVIMPLAGFPREMNMSAAEREALKWAEDALAAVRKGEVAGRVLLGGGKFYLELGEQLSQTQILLQEPALAETPAAPEPDQAEETEDADDGGDEEDSSQET